MDLEQKPAKKSFGLAADYYRVRILEIDEELPVDLDWRNDVLYSPPKRYPSKLKKTFRLQIVSYDGHVHEIAILRDEREANRRYRAMRADLRELTKMKFDDKYDIALPCTGAQPDATSATESNDKRCKSSQATETMPKDTMLFMGINKSVKSD